MNVYVFETKKLLRPLAVWVAVSALVVVMFMSGFYTSFMESKDTFIEMFSAFPDEVLQALGFDLSTVFTLDGFYAFTYAYTVIVCGVASACFGVMCLAREKRSKCSEFLFVRPASRTRVFIAKCFSALTACVVLFLLYCVVVLAYYLVYSQDLVFSGRFALLLLSMLFTQVVFLSFGILYGTIAKRVRSVASFGAIVGVGAFVLYSVTQMVDAEYINVIAPTKYFDLSYLCANGHYEVSCAIFATVLTIALYCIAFLRYSKQDTTYA